MLRLEVDYLPLLVNSLLEFILDCSELWLGNTHIDQCLISQFNCTIIGCNKVPLKAGITTFTLLVSVLVIWMFQ